MITRRTFSALALAAPILEAAGAANVRAGCQTRCYGNPPKEYAQMLKLIEDIGAAGYAGFETNQVVTGTITDLAQAKIEIARRCPLMGLHLGIRWNAPDTREKALADIKRVAEATKALGGTHIVLSGTATRGVKDAAGLEAAFSEKAKILTEAAAAIRATGIRLCFHNHQEEARNDFAELRHLAAHTKAEDVAMFYDLSHAVLAGADAVKFAREFAPRIAGFHIRDIKGEKQLPFGTGDVDLPGLAKAIREKKWSGWVVVELEGQTVDGETPPQRVRAARRYMKEKMGIG